MIDLLRFSRTRCVIFTLGIVFTSTATLGIHAQEEQAAEKPAKPKLEKPKRLIGNQVQISGADIPEKALREAVDASLALGLTRLIGLAQDENSNGTGFPFPPRGTRKKIGEKTVTRTYKEVTVTQPVYKKQYEEYTVLQPVKVGSSVEMRPVTKKRLVSKVKTGEKKVKKLVSDPNGNIKREITVPIYDEGENQRLNKGFLGLNAMALYVMNQAGLQPLQTPEQLRLYAILGQYIDAYGLPDDTFDLAWLTMAFSTYPADKPEKHLKRLTYKLLQGQIKEGKQAGLWGPDCFNPEAYIRLRQYYIELQEAHQKAVELYERRNTKRNSQRVSEWENKLFQLLELMKHVARHGNRTQEFHRSMKLEDLDEIIGYDVSVPGLTYSIHQETMSDIGSTALALRALRMANDAGVLPETYHYEIKGVRGRDLFKPERTDKALRLAMGAVLKRQNRNGGFSQMHSWQRETHFDRLNMGLVNVVKYDIPEKNTPNSSMNGYDAFASLYSLLGPESFNSNALDDLSKAMQWMTSQPQWPTYPQKDRLRSRQHGFDVEEDGGMLRFWTNAFLLSQRYRLYAMPIYANQSMYREQALRLINMQQADGSWRTEPSTVVISSSVLWEHAMIRIQRQYEAKGRELDMKKFKPEQRFDNNHQWSAQRLATVYAMMILLKDWREPMGALAAFPTSKAERATLQVTINSLSDPAPVNAGFIVRDTEAASLSPDKIDRVFILNLDSIDAEKLPGFKTRAIEITQAGGMVIVTGQSRSKGFETVKAWMDSSELNATTVDKSHGRLGGIMAQFDASTQGWSDDQGLRVIFVGFGQSPRRGMFESEDAGALIAELMRPSLTLEPPALPENFREKEGIEAVNARWVEKVNVLNTSIR